MFTLPPANSVAGETFREDFGATSRFSFELRVRYTPLITPAPRCGFPDWFGKISARGPAWGSDRW